MRGGISFEGIGIQQTTFKAGASLQALVKENDRDFVVNMPVVISGNGEVDLGTDGDTVFGFIDIYENDGHVGVTFRGFRTDVPIGATAPTIGKIAATDGSGKAKDSSSTAKARTPIFVEVDSSEKVATVFLG